MKQRDDVPAACSLSTIELRQREATLLARFRSGVIATEELSNGYAFRLSGDARCIALVADLMVAERECCPFLSFEFAAQAEMGPVTLKVFGPGDAKEFLTTILCQPDAST